MNENGYYVKLWHDDLWLNISLSNLCEWGCDSPGCEAQILYQTQSLLFPIKP